MYPYAGSYTIHIGIWVYRYMGLRHLDRDLEDAACRVGWSISRPIRQVRLAERGVYTTIAVVVVWKAFITVHPMIVFAVAGFA